MKFARFTALSTAAAAALAIGFSTTELRPDGRHAGACRKDRAGRRRADVSVEEHRAERRQFQGSHHAGRRGEGRGPRRHAAKRRPVHGVRADQQAFDKLPKGTVQTLLKPENKKMLTNVLTYHVVAGRLSANDLMQAAEARRRPDQAQDRRRRGADGRGERQHAQRLGQQGRPLQHHDPQRVPVERRDPRGRQRAAAELTRQPTTGRRCPPVRRSLGPPQHPRRAKTCLLLAQAIRIGVIRR